MVIAPCSGLSVSQSEGVGWSRDNQSGGLLHNLTITRYAGDVRQLNAEGVPARHPFCRPGDAVVSASFPVAQVSSLV